MVLDAAIRGPQVLVATQSGRVEAYDWQEGRRLGTTLALDPGAERELPPTVPCVAVSPSARRLAAGSSDGTVVVLELQESRRGRAERTLPAEGVVVCRFLDEDRLLLGSLRGEVALLDLAGGREIFRRQLDYDPVYVLALSPNGRRLAVAPRSSRMHVLDAESGAPLRTLEGHRDSVFGLAWVSESTLVSGSKDKRLLLWDLSLDPPRTRALYEGDRYVTALAIDRCGDRVAWTLEEHRIGLMGLEDRRITRRLEGHSAPIRFLAFVDEGRRLLSTGHDARILVWDVQRERRDGS